MKKILSLLLAVAAMTSISSARADDNAELTAGAKAVYDAINKRDAEATIALAHPAIYKLTKGKDNYVNLTKASMQELDKHAVSFAELTIGTPTAPIKAGDDMVSFIPTSFIISADGRKVKAKGFLIAIKSPGQAKWLYLDGAGVAQHPELIDILLPGLPKDTVFPPTSNEPVQ